MKRGKDGTPMDTQTPSTFALDAAYKPFPTFQAWAAVTYVDPVRWQRYAAELADFAKQAPETLARCRQIATRAAALDTGALEDLYQTDRGFTYSVAFETAAWEVGLAERGEQARPLFEAQLHAYESILSLATRNEPITEAAIRTLHEQICAAQPTYRVVTAIGPQEQSLPKGQYKSLSNHVRTRKGEDHSYAPVDVTPNEMARLLREMRSDAFLAAHPVQQAAYTHYAFVVIHPFADGNGRVARALASAFTYRAISMPIVILSENKTEYLDALEAADSTNYQPFVDFMLARSLDTMLLVQESLRSTSAPSLDQSAAALKDLYRTRGGYTQQQVDQAGSNLFNLMRHELTNKLISIADPTLSTQVNFDHTLAPPAVEPYRYPLEGPNRINLTLTSAKPTSATQILRYRLLLPTDASSEDDIRLERWGANEAFTVRIDELHPKPTGFLQIRIGLFADRILSEAVAALTAAAKKSLNGS